MDTSLRIVANIFCILSVFAVFHQSTAACPYDYKSKTNGCYKGYSQRSNFAQARATCSADGADLADVRTITDNDLFVSLFSPGSSFWIGLKRESLPHPLWHYAADGVIIQNQGCYRYDSSSSDFWYFGTRYYNISYQSCVDECRAASSDYDYAAVTWNSDGFRCGCAREGFRDVQFDSANKQSYENGCDKPCPGSLGTVQYCGGYKFSTILKIGGSGFDQWAAGQTNNYDGYQTCAALVTEHTPDKMGDEGCHRLFAYICHDANFNFHVHDTEVSWYEARNRCRRDYSGGDLAKLRTPADRDGLGELPKKDYWIGLINTDWKWMNGEVVTWTNWAYNHPYTKSNECVAVNLNNRQWEDRNCNDEVDNFVCVTHDSVTTSTTTTTTTPTPTTTTTTTTSTTTTTTSPTTTTTTPTTTTTSPTTTTSSTTTTTERQSQVVTTGPGSGSNGSPQGAASTGNEGSSLSLIEIIMIVLCVILIIIIIIMIVIVVYYKRKNNRLNRVAGYDGRAIAPIPYSGSIGDEVYLPANDYSSSNGSETNLIKSSRGPSIHQPSPRPEYRIAIDQKY